MGYLIFVTQMISDKHYVIVFKSSAISDLDDLERYLIEECAAPLTAKRQFQDFERRIEWLEKFAELPAIHFNLSYQHGTIIRNIPFGKKMTIIYAVENETVYILRIVPQSMIIY